MPVATVPRVRCPVSGQASDRPVQIVWSSTRYIISAAELIADPFINPKTFV